MHLINHVALKQVTGGCTSDPSSVLYIEALLAAQEALMEHFEPLNTLEEAKSLDMQKQA